MNDINEECTARGKAAIEKNLQRSVSKGKLSADESSAILARIRTSTSLADMASVDFVVEAAVEMLYAAAGGEAAEPFHVAAPDHHVVHQQRAPQGVDSLDERRFSAHGVLDRFGRL